MLTVLTAAAAALALTLSPVGAASAAPPTALQGRVDAIIAENPGAVQVDEGTIVWNGGEIILELAPLAVGSCATGKFCAYSGTNLTGSKLTYSACSTYTVTAFTVVSIANARSTNSIQARNGSGTVLATIAAGGQLGLAPAGVVSLRCV